MATMSGSQLLLSFLSVLLLLCRVSVSSIFIVENVFLLVIPTISKPLRGSRTSLIPVFATKLTASINGVRCDNKTGEVTKLQLPSGCLSGTLNPNSSLFRFHHLRYLSLSYNNFTSSSFPSGLGNLNKLELVGSFLNILNLTKLSFLDLSNNHFSVLEPTSSLFGLHHLRYLDLTLNSFTSSSLPSSLGNLNKLEILALSSNGFIGQVPSSFSNLSMLTLLYLDKNEITGGFPLIWNLASLSILDLSSNNFSGAIPSSLLTMPSLSYLNLRGNHFTDPIKVPELSASSRLEVLFVEDNLFEGKILKPISKLATLEYLDLSFLNISYPIDVRLFFTLKSLLRLDLSGKSLLATSIS
ncbi:hypothetical protein Bca101_039993 [Brassica carinata]